MPSSISTITDPTAKHDDKSDLVIRFRRWATNTDIKDLPRPHEKQRIELIVGTARTCQIRVDDPNKLVSGEHARVTFDDRGWTIYDYENKKKRKSKNGLWLDGQLSDWGPLRAGTEIGLGKKFVMMAETPRSIALRLFLARILGWNEAERIDLALRSILRGSVWLICSPSDPLALARSIHRLVFGADRPFVRCDPKGTQKDSVHWPQNFDRAADALSAAARGTLCVWAGRLPRDFKEISDALIAPTATARLAICSNKPIDGKEFLVTPIVVPPLAERQNELHHIINAYAKDALAELKGSAEHFRAEDLDWVQQNESATLAKIETATLRCVALRMTANVNQAAKLLGIKRPSLDEWIQHRQLPMHINKA